MWLRERKTKNQILNLKAVALQPPLILDIGDLILPNFFKNFALQNNEKRIFEIVRVLIVTFLISKLILLLLKTPQKIILKQKTSSRKLMTAQSVAKF